MFDSKQPEYWAVMLAAGAWIVVKAKEKSIAGKLTRGFIAMGLAFGTSEILAVDLEKNEVLMVLAVMLAYHIASDVLADIANSKEMLVTVTGIVPGILQGLLARWAGVSVAELKELQALREEERKNDTK